MMQERCRVATFLVGKKAGLYRPRQNITITVTYYTASSFWYGFGCHLGDIKTSLTSSGGHDSGWRLLRFFEGELYLGRPSSNCFLSFFNFLFIPLIFFIVYFIYFLFLLYSFVIQFFILLFVFIFLFITLLFLFAIVFLFCIILSHIKLFLSMQSFQSMKILISTWSISILERW